jgi:Rrf2 family protein
MKLSKEIRYGTRAMIELAGAHPDEALSAKEIAQRQRISVKFLEQILRTLKNAGLLKALRGVQGGYMLARPPQSIRVSDIFKAIEGDLLLVECVEEAELCPMTETCAIRDTWTELVTKLKSVLEGTTLESLLERQRRKSQYHTDIYYI